MTRLIYSLNCVMLIVAVGVGIWDTQFGVYHSWTPLSDGKRLHGQVNCCFPVAIA